MNSGFLKNGFLHVLRPEKQIQCCPYQQEDTQCGTWCPMLEDEGAYIKLSCNEVCIMNVGATK
jgi:hypothetical protein